MNAKLRALNRRPAVVIASVCAVVLVFALGRTWLKSDSSTVAPSSSKISSSSESSNTQGASPNSTFEMNSETGFQKGSYADESIRFSFPVDWLPSTNAAGFPKITGLSGGVQYELEVLDVTSDTSGDIFEYATQFLPKTVVPGGVGSLGSTDLGNYSAVLTGCLYEVGGNIGTYEDIRSMTLYAVTDGKLRVVISVGAPELAEDSEKYDGTVFDPILNSLELLSSSVVKSKDASRPDIQRSVKLLCNSSSQDFIVEKAKKYGFDCETRTFSIFGEEPTLAEQMSLLQAAGDLVDYDYVLSGYSTKTIKPVFESLGLEFHVRLLTWFPTGDPLFVYSWGNSSENPAADQFTDALKNGADADIEELRGDLIIYVPDPWKDEVVEKVLSPFAQYTGISFTIPDAFVGIDKAKAEIGLKIDDRTGSIAFVENNDDTDNIFPYTDYFLSLAITLDDGSKLSAVANDEAATPQTYALVNWINLQIQPAE